MAVSERLVDGGGGFGGDDSGRESEWSSGERVRELRRRGEMSSRAWKGHWGWSTRATRSHRDSAAGDNCSRDFGRRVCGYWAKRICAGDGGDCVVVHWLVGAAVSWFLSVCGWRRMHGRWQPWCMAATWSDGVREGAEQLGDGQKA